MKKESIGFTVISEDLTHLGGPMGTEYTTTNWERNVSKLDKAKKIAQDDYDSQIREINKQPLKWLKEGKGYRTEDLGFVMYHIKPIQIED